MKATDSTGATETATTGDDGLYELNTDAYNVRLEFFGFPEGTTAGRVVGTSGPTVRFLNADSAREDVNLSLASPQLYTTQFNYYRALDAANMDQGAVVAVP